MSHILYNCIIKMELEKKNDVIVDGNELLILSNGEVYHHGLKYYLSKNGQEKYRNVTNEKIIKKIVGLKDIVSITAKNGSSYALDKNGNLFSLNYENNGKPLLLANDSNIDNMFLMDRSVFATISGNIMKFPRSVQCDITNIKYIDQVDCLCFMLSKHGFVRLFDPLHREIRGSIILNGQNTFLDTFRFVSKLTINFGFVTVISDNGRIACYKITNSCEIINITRVESINNLTNCDDFNSDIYSDISYLSIIERGFVLMDENYLYININGVIKKISESNRIKKVTVIKNTILYQTHLNELFLWRNNRHIRVEHGSNLDSNIVTISRIESIIY